MSLSFAYYCSGHGYGHATRVSAFACHLLRLPEHQRPILWIVSSAPERVFSDSIALGALYRYAEIDPIIVQPVAYRVDRQKSVEILRTFLETKDEKLAAECAWLKAFSISCVLSDAAFLGCLAAKTAGIPSILSTNFTFDSVYSYLATPYVDSVTSSDPDTLHPGQHNPEAPDPHATVPDIPIPSEDLAPLVELIHSGYRCADLLLLLPGNIPIPSFSVLPPLPAPLWVDVKVNRFYPAVETTLMHPSTSPVHSPLPYPPHSTLYNAKIDRKIIETPLIVRSTEPSVYTPEGRSALLSSIGIPPEMHNPATTKILIVSFGGQMIRKPSTPNSRSSSKRNSGQITPLTVPDLAFYPPTPVDDIRPASAATDTPLKELRNIVNVQHAWDNSHYRQGSLPSMQVSKLLSGETGHRPSASLDFDIPNSPFPKLATPSHMYFPGAPPVNKPPSTPPALLSPTFTTIPPTPGPRSAYFTDEHVQPAVEETPLFPDQSWIAIVCGVSKEQWSALDKGEDGSELPQGFYVAPRDIYMPDLTAVADVLLGKLGYGTVSECVNASTPFVYVSRPLFIEEHGLRLLLERDGVGVELKREAYEAGDWASAVQEAYTRGQAKKNKIRSERKNGDWIDPRLEEGGNLARTVVDWVKSTWSAHRLTA